MLLLDVQMPGMNGLESAERIIAMDSTARVLFLTTFADKDYVSRALALGAKGYVIKQDVASVVPALQAVMAGQTVLGAEAVANLSIVKQDEQTQKNPAEPVPRRFQTLTDREREIVTLVADGLDNQAIARRLYLSEGTVRNHISAILAKTNLANRTQLAVEWLSSHES